MSFKKQLFFIVFIFIIDASLCAELLIIKKTATGWESLENSSEVDVATIAQILLKFEWPMCISADLTAAERRELLDSTDQPYGEEKLIQRKLDEAFNQTPGEGYQVVFVPTALYELFCISSMFEIARDPTKNQAFYDELICALEYAFQNKANLSSDALISATTTWKNFFTAYNNVNNSFVTAHRSSAVSLDDAQNPLYKGSLFYHFNNLLVAKLLERFSSLHLPSNSTELARAIEQEVSRFTLELIDKIIEYHLYEYNPVIEDLKNIKGFYQLLIDIRKKLNTPCAFSILYKTVSKFIEEKENFLIKKNIDLEYEARLRNQALLMRGTTFQIEQNGFLKEDQTLVAGTTIDLYMHGMDEFRGEPLAKKYIDKEVYPYSIAFGNSLFGGILFDQTACAYHFLIGGRQNTAHTFKPGEGKHMGYALLINKREYLIDRCNKLFFISSLSSVATLFMKGEWFHSRTTAAVFNKHDDQLVRRDTAGFVLVDKNSGIVSKKKYYNPSQLDQLRKVKSLKKENLIGSFSFRGMQGRVFNGKNDIIVIERDPFKHAALFSAFVVKNGRIIQYGDEQDYTQEEKDFFEKIKNNQEKSSKFYKAAKVVYPRVHRFITNSERLKKVRDRINDKKKLQSK